MTPPQANVTSAERIAELKVKISKRGQGFVDDDELVSLLGSELAAARADAERMRLRSDIMCDLAYAHGVQAGQIIPDCDVAAKERLRLAMERRVTEALRARSALAGEG